MSTSRIIPESAPPGGNGLRPGPAREPMADGLEVIRWAGGGGMGEVWQALQLAEQRVVALKVMRPLSGGEADRRRAEERFRREIAIAAQFEHPALARVFGSGLAADGCLYYLMEWVEGEPLDAFLRGGSTARSDLESRVRLAEALCEGVACLHAEGFLHRDLKPANILVTPDGTPKIIDPGLARSLIDGEFGATLSLDGAVLGTPGFMAPEQAAGESRRIGLPSDVWALGLLLFHLFTNEWPFAMDGPASEVLARVVTGEPARPRAVDRRVPRDLEAIVLRCLEREPASRYPTAEALAEDLRRYLAGEPVAARGATLGYVFSKFLRRHRIASALVIGAVVTAAAAAGWHQHAQAETNRRLQAALDESTNLRSFLLFDLRWDFDRAGREDILTAASRRAEDFSAGAAGNLPPGARFDRRRFEALAASLRGQAAAFRENLAGALAEYQREHALNLQLASAFPADPIIALDGVASAGNVAALLFRLERAAEAPALLDGALALLDRVTAAALPPDVPALAPAEHRIRLHSLLARAHRETGRLPDAQADATRAFELVCEQNPTATHRPDLAPLYAETRLEEARVARAQDQAEHALNVLADVRPRIDDPDVPLAVRLGAMAANRCEAALTYLDLGQTTAAGFELELAAKHLADRRREGYYEPSMWSEREVARAAQALGRKLLDQQRPFDADAWLAFSGHLLEVRYHHPAAMRVPLADLVELHILQARAFRLKGDLRDAALKADVVIRRATEIAEVDPDNPRWHLEIASHGLFLADLLEERPKFLPSQDPAELRARAALALHEASVHPRLTPDQRKEIERLRARLPPSTPPNPDVPAPQAPAEPTAPP